MAQLRIRDCALSTSGSEEQFFDYQGNATGHIIDPRSGKPAGSVTSVTVVAQTTAVCDALATAFYVGGATWLSVIVLRTRMFWRSCWKVVQRLRLLLAATVDAGLRVVYDNYVTVGDSWLAPEEPDVYRTGCLR